MSSFGFGGTNAHAVIEQAPAAVPVAAPPPPVYVVPATGFRYHALMVQVEGGYTLTHGNTADALNGGWNTGLGVTWYPSPSLPLGLRLDGNYSRFDLTTQSLNAALPASTTRSARPTKSRSSSRRSRLGPRRHAGDGRQAAPGRDRSRVGLPSLHSLRAQEACGRGARPSGSRKR